MLPFFFSFRAPLVDFDLSQQSFNSRLLTWSIVAAPTTATILPALARASRMGAGRAAALVEALLTERVGRRERELRG